MKEKKDAVQIAYAEKIKRTLPKLPLWKGCTKAFLVGGFICAIGQLISIFGRDILHLSEVHNVAFTPIVMVFIGATLTGIGVYDEIARFGSAGSIIPITGFANSIVSEAIEHKREGYVMGIGAKMFVLAGPVLVFGICTSIIIGLISLLWGG